MEGPVFIRDSRSRKIIMAKFYCVGDDKSLGEGIHHLKAAVMLEGRADAEAVATTESPGFAFAWLVVDDDGTAAGANGCSIEVERCIVVALPG